MYRINTWNENEKFFPKKIAQDLLDERTSCVNTSCCIDTTKITSGPCGSDIQTSCCIDTTKE
ncbi:hypothetical protein [Methanobrevibacter sp.]|uniref:hypothetical protein n=1 Tax=Methanobrevibacter sp. TaxID=66852 RepID=UPI0026E062AE|nr:hypothetical protein [Methanobrevibacter sp.]MDO5859185.1 hypothetical protein [Methanobrevibacter sp.]